MAAPTLLHLVLAPRLAAGIWQAPPRSGSHEACLGALAAIETLPEFRHDVVIIGASSRSSCLGWWAGATALAIGVPGGVVGLAGRVLRREFARRACPAAVLAWDAALGEVTRGVWSQRAAVSTIDLNRGLVSTRWMSAGGVQGLSAYPLGEGWALPRASREEARERLGIRPDRGIISALDGSEITTLTFVVGILRASGERVDGLVAAGAWGLRRAQQHEAGRENLREPVVVEAAPGELLRASDLVLLEPASREGVERCRRSVLQAWGVGVLPVRGPEPELEGLFTGSLRACVARSWAYSDLAYTCRRLLVDPLLRRECVEQARQQHTLAPIGRALREAWRVAGQTALRAGAGLVG